MKKVTPAQKKIYEILGFVDTKKVQASVKISEELHDRVSEASEVLDIFICDIYESALTKLLDELQPLIDQKKPGGSNVKKEESSNSVSKPRISPQRLKSRKGTNSSAAS
jgi:hypothetical protein